jgi:hypothetical protein
VRDHDDIGRGEIRRCVRRDQLREVVARAHGRE